MAELKEGLERKEARAGVGEGLGVTDSLPCLFPTLSHSCLLLLSRTLLSSVVASIVIIFILRLCIVVSPLFLFTLPCSQDHSAMREWMYSFVPLFCCAVNSLLFRMTRRSTPASVRTNNAKGVVSTSNFFQRISATLNNETTNQHEMIPGQAKSGHQNYQQLSSSSSSSLAVPPALSDPLSVILRLNRVTPPRSSITTVILRYYTKCFHTRRN